MGIAFRGYMSASGSEPPERTQPDLSQCQTYMLPRHGKRPVSFSGVLLAENFGKPDTWEYREDWGGIRVTHYYDLAVYQVADGSYIVQWVYSGTQEGDMPHHEVGKFDALEEAIAALETFDPLKWLAEPVPQGDQARLRERYAAQVSALCDDLEVVEAW